jgi:ATP-dependent DNA helicase MPH1
MTHRRPPSAWCVYLPLFSPLSLPQINLSSSSRSQLQRVGRTGRKRDGHVHVLLAEIREELNWDKAKDTYGELQKCIVRGDQLELYGDVPRLLPDHLRPEVLEKRMEIEEYVREEPGRKKASFAAEDEGSTVKGKKRKRNDDIGRNIPPGASHGFVSVADLLVKTKKKKIKTREFDAALADDDSTDMELEENILLTQRAASTSNTAESSSKNKNSLRKSRTMDPVKKRKKSPSGKKGKEKASAAVAANRFSHKGDNSDKDTEIDQDMSRGLRNKAPIQSSPRKNREPSPRYWSSSPDRPLANDNLREVGTASSSIKRSPCHGKPRVSKSANSDGLLVPNNPTTPSVWSSSPKFTPNEVIELTSSPSPTRSTSPQQLSTTTGVHPDPASSSKRKGKERALSYRDSMSPVPVPPAAPGDNQDIAWLLDDDDDPDIQILSSSPVIPKAKHSAPRLRSVQDDSILKAGDNILEVEILAMKPVSPLCPKVWRASDMPPPALPYRTAQPSPGLSSDTDVPEASFVVRPAGRRRAIPAEALGTPDIQSPLRRLKRKDTELVPRASTPPLQPKKKKHKPITSIRHNPWLDGEAMHSGDEESEGSSHSEDDVESDSDRQFLKDVADTQVSPSYDQAVAYRQSLLSQAPRLAGGPTFANRPVRRGGFTSARDHAHRRLMFSSSPPRDNSEPDEYAIGSFVVDDDADISFD